MRRFLAYGWLVFLVRTCYSEDVIEWLVSKGGRVNGLELGEFEGMGRGLLCGLRLETGREALFVPRTMIFRGSSGRAVASAFGETGPLSDLEAIAFQLIFEVAKGPASTWAPYLTVLPKYIVTPKAFGAEALQALQDQGLAERATKMRAVRTAAFIKLKKSLKLAIQSGCAEGTPGSSNNSKNVACVRKHLSISMWAWAGAIVDSRALTFQGQRHLVPVADLVNYGLRPDGASSGSGDYFLRHHILNEDGVATRSDRDCVAGTQFLEDYGDNPTVVYAEHHGFVPSKANPFDCAPLTLPALNYDGNDAANLRIDVLSGLGVTGMPSTCVPGTLDHLAQDTRYLLWTLQMDRLQLEACLRALGNGAPSPGCEYASAPKGHTVALAISQYANATLAIYATTLNEDLALEKTGDLPQDLKLALMLRKSRKVLLTQLKKETAGAANRNIASPPLAKEAVLTVFANESELETDSLLGPLGPRVDAFNKQVPIPNIVGHLFPRTGGRWRCAGPCSTSRQQSWKATGGVWARSPPRPSHKARFTSRFPSLRALALRLRGENSEMQPRV